MKQHRDQTYARSRKISIIIQRLEMTSFRDMLAKSLSSVYHRLGTREKR